MKKLLLALAGIAFVAGSAVAQDYEKNIFGVRAGVNVANMSAQGFSANSKVEFHVAGVYQRLLSSSMPLYLETGLSFSQKGCKYGHGIENIKANAMYLQIPVMVNYKFNIKDAVTLYPSAGFYYGLGIGGKVKGLEMDAFGKTGALKRSDFGMRLSATVEWKKISFGIGYEFGFMDINEHLDFEGDREYNGYNSSISEGALPKVKTGNFFISVGYNF